MSLTASIREQVRQRAQCACEFCGVAEIDTGGMLTIDHFQPRTKAGSDDLENLIYACITCNQYKQDYWPRTATAPILWNPRQESASEHFVEQEDGQLIALTPIGIFTIKRLRLNRSQLIVARQRRQQQLQAEKLLQRYQELTTLQAQINIQLTDLAMEQQVLLKEQRKWLRMLLNRINQ
jgi:CMP-N-acetylneuraminic acid synthetase